MRVSVAIGYTNYVTRGLSSTMFASLVANAVSNPFDVVKSRVQVLLTFFLSFFLFLFLFFLFCLSLPLANAVSNPPRRCQVA